MTIVVYYCVQDSETTFHFIGLKCTSCGSYNTVRNGNETLPLEDVDPSLPFANNDDQDDDMYLLDPLNGFMPPGYQLHPTPSTDSDDEYDTPSSPRSHSISDEDFDDDEELAEQLLGGIPLLPPWLPQHGHNPELLHLANQLALNLNLDGNNSFTEDYPVNNNGDDNINDSTSGNWDNSIELSPYVQLASSFLPMGGLISESGPDSDSGLPNIWEVVSDTVSDDRDDDHGGEGEGSHSECSWETDSEEEVVGGDEEDLGKEDCQVTAAATATATSTGPAEETNQLGDMAPAN